MSCNWLRTIWALLLLMMVVNNAQMPASLDREKLANNVVQVIAAHRLSVEPMLSVRDQFPDAARFRAPGCEEPIEVIPVHINLQEAPLFDALITANYKRQFVYLDQTWLSENRVAMRLTWLKHKMLSFLGWGRFVTIPTGLLIVSPPDCHAAEAIDWTPVWSWRVIAAGVQVPDTSLSAKEPRDAAAIAVQESELSHRLRWRGWPARWPHIRRTILVPVAAEALLPSRLNR